MAESTAQGAAPTPVTSRAHPVRQYVERVASIDEEKYPEWNTKRALPKLPVPELGDTLDKYLAAIRPVVSQAQFERTEKLCTEFNTKSGEGEQLQKQLNEFANTKDNWCTEFWLDDMYLKARLALPINSNVGMVFPRQKFPDKDAQLRYSARLISGILDYKSIIDTRSLPVDRARSREKGQPLCMAQYYRLFSTYRVPGVDKDHHFTNKSTGKSHPHDPMVTPENDHIIVACHNQFFSLDVVSNYTRLSDDDLFTQLKRIVQLAEDGLLSRTDYKVGILTAQDRTDWARSRQKLMEDATNRESLELIEKCIFVLNLDNAIPLSFNHQKSIDETEQNRRDDVSLAQQMLHGFGPRVNACNRWFDKTMQFIICEDGACGLNYEHSPSEGIAVVQLIEHLLKYMEEVRKRKLPRMQSICELAYPKTLRWKMTPDITGDMEKSMTNLSTLIGSLDLYVLRFHEFGREFPKKHNMSPDAFIQLAIQLTYYKVHGHLVSTYESASIRRFRLGRVDNIRACTSEALEWCKAMIGETEATDEERMELFRKAIKQQTDILVQTILGYGIDNHLLGLRCIAEKTCKMTPAIFEDESYRISNHFTLSTSQVPTTMDAFMCYGPVVPDGYGVCYNPHPDYMLCAITSFNTCGETRSDFFAFTLESSFMQMREICLKSAQMAADKAAGLVTGSNGVSNGQVVGVKERTTAKVRVNSPAHNSSKLRHQERSSSEESTDGSQQISGDGGGAANGTK